MCWRFSHAAASLWKSPPHSQCSHDAAFNMCCETAQREFLHSVGSWATLSPHPKEASIKWREWQIYVTFDSRRSLEEHKLSLSFLMFANDHKKLKMKDSTSMQTLLGLKQKQMELVQKPANSATNVTFVELVKNCLDPKKRNRSVQGNKKQFVHCCERNTSSCL